MYSIELRYCGGCNSQIDRSRIISKVKEGLKKSTIRVDFYADKKINTDIVLLMQGCMHACLEEEYLGEGDSSQIISVKGEMVDDQYVEEKSIPEFLINKIISKKTGSTLGSGNKGTGVSP